MRVLVIEDDKVLSAAVCGSLVGRFEYDQVYDGEEGLYLAEGNIYDVIILDLMMPKMDGYQVLSAMREKGIPTPVIILTAKDGIDDKVKGFQLGADDYLVKPFHRQELIVRLESLIRRSGGQLQKNILHFHDLTLNIGSRTAKIGDQELALIGKQFDMLEYLTSNPNTILTKRQIFDRIWGFDSETTPTVVDVYISNIRKALQPGGYDKYIRTVRGVGYMIVDGGDGHE
jgi:two-component system, OmpR family, response regulator CiaR